MTDPRMCNLDLDIHNPYWDAVAAHVKPAKLLGGGDVVGEPQWDAAQGHSLTDVLDRFDYVPKYAWTITDPDSVKFVADHSLKAVIDPMAGTGYWAYLLRQLDVEVICYDRDLSIENIYHGGNNKFCSITEMDCLESVVKHPKHTMLLSWPPMCNSGYAALANYLGSRVIYIGESDGGCCGSDRLFEMLEDQWVEVAWRRPIQWWGLHDYITVYDRKET